MDNEHLIFQNALDDIEDLLDLLNTETREDMKLVWEYHLFLNGQIIANILNHDHTQTCWLVAEIKRSIEASVKYYITEYQINEEDL